jgi:hypothetical protein
MCIRQLIKTVIMYHGNVSPVSSLHLFLLRIITLLSGGNRAIELDSFVIKQIKKHENDRPKGKRDPRSISFLAKLMDMEDDLKVDRANLMDTCSASIGASPDTRGTNLADELWYLYKNLAQFHRLRDDIE